MTLLLYFSDSLSNKQLLVNLETWYLVRVIKRNDKIISEILFCHRERFREGAQVPPVTLLITIMNRHFYLQCVQFFPNSNCICTRILFISYTQTILIIILIFDSNFFKC